MAADAPLLSELTARFTAEERERIARAADTQGLEDFLREAALKMAGNLLSAGAAPAGEGPGEQPEARGQGGDGRAAADPGPDLAPATPLTAAPVLPLATLGDDAAAWFARADRQEELLCEVVALATTQLSELYAHTAFRDPAHERECRDRAEEKVARIAPSIQRLLAARHKKPN